MEKVKIYATPALIFFEIPGRTNVALIVHT